MLLCGIFNGESHHMQRQSSDHSSVVKMGFTYLDKIKRENRRKMFNRIL